MVLPDPDAAIVDAHERIDEVEESVTTKHEGLLQRIEALERFDGHIAETMGRDGVAGRLEALEERLETHAAVFRADGITADGFDKRIRELEGQWSKEVSKHMALVEQHNKLVLAVNGDSAEMRDLELTKARYDVQEWLPNIAERERQARWHATYNAVVGFVIGNIMTAREDSLVYDLDRAHRAAAAAADRAHGPLEAKAAKGIQDVRGTVECSCGRTVLVADRAEVEALVKAAIDVDALSVTVGDGIEEVRPEVMQALRNAIKPFEASRGGE